MSVCFLQCVEIMILPESMILAGSWTQIVDSGLVMPWPRQDLGQEIFFCLGHIPLTPFFSSGPDFAFV